MFYEGDLQSGIGKAVQESKLVACFVTDDEDESQLWENDFLREDILKDALADQTVLLRLKAGSQEAGYLAAIFPLPKTPTFVVIKNGELKEYLASGVTKEEFLRRLGVVLESRGPYSSVGISSAQASSSAPLAPADSAPSSSTQTSTSTSNAPPPNSTSSEQQSQAVQQLLAERSARLEIHKKEQEAKEKAKRQAEAKARREALEAEAAANPDSKKSADMKYALLQKKRQQEARDERARILKRVEDDKAERREREAQRKVQAKAAASGENTAPASGEASSIQGPASRQSAECALQIRLFDGSTIRSRFPSSGTLRSVVRPWIDEKQGGDQPYTFKHVLTPLPNKNIETSEEECSLQDLGLTPSATLILLPVTGYTSAYAGDGGILSRGVGLIGSGMGMVTGVLGSFLGGAAAPAPAPAPQREGEVAVDNRPSTGINVRTLRDQRQDDQQFYNGNALNFEPRKDEDDKKED